MTTRLDRTDNVQVSHAKIELEDFASSRHEDSESQPHPHDPSQLTEHSHSDSNISAITQADVEEEEILDQNLAKDFRSEPGPRSYSFHPFSESPPPRDELKNDQPPGPAEVVIGRDPRGTFHFQPINRRQADFSLPADYHQIKRKDLPPPLKFDRGPGPTSKPKGYLPPPASQTDYGPHESQPPYLGPFPRHENPPVFSTPQGYIPPPISIAEPPPPAHRPADFHFPRDYAPPAPYGMQYQVPPPQSAFQMQEFVTALQATVMQGMSGIAKEISASLSQSKVEQAIDQYAKHHPPSGQDSAPTQPQSRESSRPSSRRSRKTHRARDTSHYPSRTPASQTTRVPPGEHSQRQRLSEQTTHHHGPDSPLPQHRVGRGTHTQSRHNSPVPADSETDSESQTDSTAPRSSYSPSRRTNYSFSPRLPPFTGQEDWKVYYNRFEAVAAQQNWSESRKLSELLPRIQGKAGDFVFGQLNPSVHSNFKLLCKELKSRFRVVETARTYSAKFSTRDQIQGESVQDYAAELKRLYDKAHASRDRQTRQEDLLRRFLDGLNDERARFQVEFVKQPDNIDSAVYEVISCQETKKRINFDHDRKGKKSTRAIFTETSTSEGETSDSDDEVRAVHPSVTSPYSNGKNKKGPVHQSHKKAQPKPPSTPLAKEGAQKDTSSEIVKQLLARIAQLEGSQTKITPSNPIHSPQRLPPRCYRCGELGHFVKECPVAPIPTQALPTQTNPASPTESNVQSNCRRPVQAGN